MAGTVVNDQRTAQRAATGQLFRLLRLLLVLVLAPSLALAQGTVSARSVVEKGKVYVQEPFILQVVVSGDENPGAPDLSSLDGFEVKPLGGRSNSSSFVTAINGRVTQRVERGYIYMYRLTPQREGRLTIPSLVVDTTSGSARTDPVIIEVVKGGETNDVKLRLELSSETAYVGQPITVTVAWYLGRDVDEYNFRLPILNDPRFRVADLPAEAAAAGAADAIQLTVDGRAVVAKKSQGALDGRKYLVLRFRQVLIPVSSGAIALPRASVSGSIIAGYRQARSPFGDTFNDPFFRDDFFSGFGREAVHERFTAASNEPILNVQPLPVADRPADFTGLVGNYSIIANASPTDISVGDPITLTIQVAGPDYMGNAVLPPLDKQPEIRRDFKVPSEITAPQAARGIATFTQTIRPMNPAVNAIPPIRLPYFDPNRGVYAVAQSDPIPIKVSGTRIVTADDVEGRPAAGEQQAPLETRREGIAHNYADVSALAPQQAGLRDVLQNAAWLGLLAVPPLCYLLLLAAVLWTRSGAARRNGSARRGLTKFTIASQGAESADALLAALRAYLVQRLTLPPGSATRAEFTAALEARRVPVAVTTELADLFGRLEGACYAGQSADMAALRTAAQNVIKKLEGTLR